MWMDLSSKNTRKLGARRGNDLHNCHMRGMGAMMGKKTLSLNNREGLKGL
jgi:hypothetical protein